MESLDLFYISNYLFAQYENEAKEYPYSLQMKKKLTEYIEDSKISLDSKNIKITKILNDKNQIMNKELIIEKDNIKITSPYKPSNFAFRMNIFDGQLRSKVEGLL